MSLSLDEYCSRARELHKQLFGIAENTGYMANGGEVDATTNTNFRIAMQKYYDLLKQLRDLDNQHFGVRS